MEKESNLCQVRKTWCQSYQVYPNLGKVNQNWPNFNQNRTNLCQIHPIRVKLYQNNSNLGNLDGVYRMLTDIIHKSDSQIASYQVTTQNQEGTALLILCCWLIFRHLRNENFCSGRNDCLIPVVRRFIRTICIYTNNLDIRIFFF